MNGAFEDQYKRLVAEIETIYSGAKEFHAHGYVAPFVPCRAVPLTSGGACPDDRATGWSRRPLLFCSPWRPPPPGCRPPSIDLLIQQFNYHVMFKRWNDTFTAVPFKPK